MAPPRYHLGHALRYSGLYGLPPIVYGEDEAAPTLQAVLYPEAAGFRTAGTPPAIEVLVVQPAPRQLPPLPQLPDGQPLLVYGLQPSPLADALLEQLRQMLRLDEDLEVFYRLAKQDPELAWAATGDGARLLRAATAFEDLVQCLAISYESPALTTAFLKQLSEALGPRTTLGRYGFPSPAAIAEAPTRLYDQLIAHVLAELTAPRSGRRSAAGGSTRTAAAVRSLGKALHELSCLCASGSLHPDSLRRRPGELTRILDADDDAAWQDALHEELEWQERVRALLESLPGYCRRGGSRATEEMLLRIGCYDGVRLDPAARAAWERRFPQSTLPAKRRTARANHPPLPAPPLSGSLTGPNPRAEQHASGLRIARRIARRVSPFSIYRGLAQALLLRVPSAVYNPRQ